MDKKQQSAAWADDDEDDSDEGEGAFGLGAAQREEKKNKRAADQVSMRVCNNLGLDQEHYSGPSKINVIDD